MATYQGKNAQFKEGANVLAEAREWRVNATADADEDTVIGDTWRTRKAGLKSWTFSASVFWDETDAAQTALVEGAEVTISAEPEGDATASVYYTGACVVTSLEISGRSDGFVEADISGEGNGALTRSVVP